MFLIKYEIQTLQGPQGLPGLPGPKGINGLVGLPGFKGENGPTGLPGPKGSPGSKGPPGSKGSPGSRGLSGPPGLPGSKGENGLTGLLGPKGVQGVPGSDGVNGLPGLTGPKGEKGVSGIKGSTGSKGLPGSRGAPGASGLPGIKGERGMSSALESKLAMMKCQSGQTGYKLIANTCYFFDNVKRLRAEAIVNCVSKFPSGGRFIEPRTDKFFDLIEKASISYFGSSYVWLGVEYSSQRDAFIYKSDGAPVVMKKWYRNSAAQPSDNTYQRRAENNYSTFGLSFKGWFNNFNDRSTQYSICEPN